MKGFYILVFIIIFLTAANARQGWVSQTSLLGTEVLGKVQFVSSTEGWIASGNGQLLHTTDDGSNWSIVSPEPIDTIKLVAEGALSFVNQADGWMIGTLGNFNNPAGAVLYRTNNGGILWNRTSLSSGSYGFAIQFIDPNNGWAVVGNGSFSDLSSILIRTTDGGINWSVLDTNSRRVILPYFIDVNNGWAMVDSVDTTGTLVSPSEILHTTDGGATWAIQLRDNTLGRIESIQMIDGNNGWIVGDSAKILHTTNGGINWQSVSNTGIGSSYKSKAVFFLDVNHGWIGSGGSGVNVVLHTTNAGGSWTSNPSGTQYNVFSIYFTDLNNGWLSADYGGIAHTTSGGELTSVREDHRPGIPSRFTLNQNYPNPFNPSTTIAFSLPKSGYITLKVIDILGREVATLAEGRRKAGKYNVDWNSSALPSGVYFYKITSGKFSDVKKMILIK